MFCCFLDPSSSKQNGLLLQTESQLLQEQSKYENECVENHGSSQAKPPNVIVTVDEPDKDVIGDCPPNTQRDLSENSEERCNLVADQVESSTDQDLSNVSEVHSFVCFVI